MKTYSHRVYFWFEFVSPHRIGGPWWYRNFHSLTAAGKFNREIAKLCWATCLEEGRYTEYEKGESNGHIMEICPEHAQSVQYHNECPYAFTPEDGQYHYKGEE